MTLRSSDLQSDSDLDSIRNSCDVFLGGGDKKRLYGNGGCVVEEISLTICLFDKSSSLKT